MPDSKTRTRSILTVLGTVQTVKRQLHVEPYVSSLLLPHKIDACATIAFVGEPFRSCARESPDRTGRKRRPSDIRATKTCTWSRGSSGECALPRSLTRADRTSRRAIARRPEDLSRVFEYLVKWAGWPVEDSTWEKDDQFPRTNQFVKDFVDTAMAERVELRPAVSILAEARPYLDARGDFKVGSDENSSPASVPAERAETTQPQTQGSPAATSVSAPATSSTP